MTTNATTDAMATLHGFIERDDATRILGTVGLTVALLVWGYYRYISTPDLSFLPRAGKAPGWFGYGINDVKRDFAKNGTKIINEGYRKVSRLPNRAAQLELTNSPLTE
jgi:hypothetical protein